MFTNPTWRYHAESAVFAPFWALNLKVPCILKPLKPQGFGFSMFWSRLAKPRDFVPKPRESLHLPEIGNFYFDNSKAIHFLIFHGFGSIFEFSITFSTFLKSYLKTICMKKSLRTSTFSKMLVWANLVR
jgi:hypothetical protein